jgi:tRNA (guanine37-N1)-methyltransferase
MNISIISVFPDLYGSFLKTSLVGRAQEKKLVSIDVTSFFSVVSPKERIDSPTFGPGPGMLIRPEVVEKVIETQEEKYGPAIKIFFSPQGEKIDQRILQKLAHLATEKKHLLMVAGRYEGIDTRVEEHYADMTLSLGDFVLMSGDLAAMVLLEGVLRLIPDIVGKQESVQRESFTGAFVDFPQYTVPVVWKDRSVPDIVRSGNHAAIEQWREQQAVQKTVMQHFSWLRSHLVDERQKQVVAHYIPPHYAALLHADVLLPDGTVGTSSVTSLDIHDGARSAKTYGLKQYFIVTPLLDQQKIAHTLLDFWHTGPGVSYNVHRHEAVQAVSVMNSLDETIAWIEKKEGKRPLVVATSAREVLHVSTINYFDQSKVWQHNRPVLLIFGTAKGLSPAVLDRCDYVLLPIEGFTTFNHLSVRSAIAIVFDRWLGINLK